MKTKTDVKYEFCNGKSVGRTSDDVQLCEKHAPKKQKTPDTFWLARDNHILKDCSWVYKISPKKMKFTYYECEFEKCFYVDSGELMDVFLAGTIKLLGLPRLRKGQQVQVRRTGRGFEVVGGKK